MAVAYLLEWSGVCRRQAARLAAALEWESSLAEGKIVFREGTPAGSLALLEAWESPAAFNRFFEELLLPALAEAGLPRPGMTSWRLPDSGQACLGDPPSTGLDCRVYRPGNGLFSDFGPAPEAQIDSRWGNN